ncbi:hypothetical protein SDC9_164731 [bioreactor metagenome]|uniref:Uncharacterized protein n=1 Tax=bioreactor metagenome TaxID=1076179 RepID=A0A645FSD9_9ZZZZ
MRKDFEVVFQRAHPRRHLLFLAAGQETDVLADRNRDTGHDDLGEMLVFQRLRQAGRQRQQGLAGAGLAEQGDEIDVRVHQQVQSEILFAVACGNTPDGVLWVGVIDQRFQDGGLAGGFLDDGGETIAFEPDEFIDQELRAQRASDLVVGLAVLFPRLHALAVLVPEVVG